MDPSPWNLAWMEMTSSPDTMVTKTISILEKSWPWDWEKSGMSCIWEPKPGAEQPPEKVRASRALRFEGGGGGVAIGGMAMDMEVVAMGGIAIGGIPIGEVANGGMAMGGMELVIVEVEESVLLLS
jgi:hypothetical protein